MREFTLDDIDAVYEFSICPEVTRFTGDAGAIKTKVDAERVIRDTWLYGYSKYGYARYALIHKGDRRIIGFCGVKFEEELGCPDIGYRILPQYWGRGLATEAAAAALKYAREELGIAGIIGEAAVQNVASNRMLRKLGFRHVATYEKKGLMINRYE